MELKRILAQKIHPKIMNRGEQKMLDLLIKEGIATDPEQHHFNQKLASAIIRCPDGTKSRYLLQLLNQMYLPKMREHLQHHDLTRHGGGILLAPGSPIVPIGHTTDIDLMADIELSAKMGYKSIILTVHFPCAMARLHNISPLETIDSLIRAKKRIKKQISGTTVACFLQCTHSGQNSEDIKESLYFISRAMYETWRAKHSMNTLF